MFEYDSQKPEKYYGLKITEASFGDSAIVLKFENGVTVHIYDDGQYCCEERYMTTDDDVASLTGETLRRIIVLYSDSSNEGEYGDCHEEMFLEVATDKSSITVCTHNIHNGYYGGFCLKIKEI